MFANRSWYFLTVCFSKAFLTSAFWGLIKRSTSGVDEEDELPWVDALFVAELPWSFEFDLLPVDLWLLLPFPLFGEFLSSLSLSRFVSSPSLSRFVSSLSLSRFVTFSAAWRFLLEAPPPTSLQRSSDVTFSLLIPRATRSNSVAVSVFVVAAVTSVVSSGRAVSAVGGGLGPLGPPLSGRPIPLQFEMEKRSKFHEKKKMFSFAWSTKEVGLILITIPFLYLEGCQVQEGTLTVRISASLK